MTARELRLRTRIDALTDRVEELEATLARERENVRKARDLTERVEQLEATVALERENTRKARKACTQWLNRAHKAEARLLDRGRGREMVA